MLVLGIDPGTIVAGYGLVRLHEGRRWSILILDVFIRVKAPCINVCGICIKRCKK